MRNVYLSIHTIYPAIFVIFDISRFISRNYCLIAERNIVLSPFLDDSLLSRFWKNRNPNTRPRCKSP